MSDIKNILDALGGMASTGDEIIRPVEVIPSGLDLLDNYVIGCGGFPRGRVTEIHGKYSSGKSTLGMWFAGLIQKNGGTVAWIDAEYAMTKEYATSCGIDISKLIMPELGNGEDILNKIKLMIATNKIDAIFVDSIEAIKSEAHTDDSMHTRLASARMWSDFWRDITSGFKILNPNNPKEFVKNPRPVKTFVEGKLILSNEIHKLSYTNTALICINHLYKQIGVVFGDKSRTGGGDRKDFAFDLKLKTAIVKSKKKGKNKELQYKIVKVDNKKNRLGIPLRACQLKMYTDGRIEDLEKVEVIEDEDDNIKGLDPSNI